MGIVKLKTESHTVNRKPHRKVAKLKSTFYLFPGLAQSGTEQPSQGATLLGWPKSIYYTSLNHQSQLTWSFMCQFLDLLKFETRSSSLLNFANFFPQRPRSFWWAPRITTSGKVQFFEHAQSNQNAPLNYVLFTSSFSYATLSNASWRVRFSENFGKIWNYLRKNPTYIVPNTVLNTGCIVYRYTRVLSLQVRIMYF